ncbi:MAG TPA: cytochrome c oxidase assembly protein [Stellaceae bacterium]|nr:cytochrome c oxidase assembly protein [Stellaceae bacterium]
MQGLSFASLAGPAHAQGGEASIAAAGLDWHFTPDVVVATALFALIYAAGIARRRAGAAARPQLLGHVAFFAGLVVVFLALQSPIDTISEHLFAMHQVQHLLLRMMGPMLIALAAPQATLIAGLPWTVRKAVLRPLAGNRGMQAVFAVLAQPVMATALFIGVLYFWEIPRYQDLAVHNEAVHYAMHAVMLIAGLFFWWRIFDRRAPPAGLRYGVRLMMLWLAMLSNIVLGAYTTFKTPVLYRAYGLAERFWGISPADDEHLGGIVIWILSSMMCAIAVVIVLSLWARWEAQVEERRTGAWAAPASAAVAPISQCAAPPPAIGGRELADRQRSQNRTLALGFAVFAAVVFSAALLVGVADHLLGAG